MCEVITGHVVRRGPTMIQLTPAMNVAQIGYPIGWGALDCTLPHTIFVREGVEVRAKLTPDGESAFQMNSFVCAGCASNAICSLYDPGIALNS